MTPANKAHLSKVQKARWRKIGIYADILQKSKQEVNLNLKLCDKYSKQLREGGAFYIDLILREGNWNEPYNGEVLKEKSAKEINDRNRERYEKEKKKDPLQELKLMFWVINKIGSIDKVEKIFQAAKIAMESEKK